MIRLLCRKPILPPHLSCHQYFNKARYFSTVKRLTPVSGRKSGTTKPPDDESTEKVNPVLIELSKAELIKLANTPGRREDWQVIYCLQAMPLAQAFSKLKLLLTFSLVAGTPISIALHLAEKVNSDLCWFVFGASLFSLATLSVFSYFSTKVVGVLSKHKPTGLLRIGLLSFWGRRCNVIVHPKQLLPASDVSGRSVKRTVKVGLTGDALNTEYSTIRPLYISSLTGRVLDTDLFEKYVGKMWRP